MARGPKLAGANGTLKTLEHPYKSKQAAKRAALHAWQHIEEVRDIIRENSETLVAYANSSRRRSGMNARHLHPLSGCFRPKGDYRERAAADRISSSVQLRDNQIVSAAPDKCHQLMPLCR
ncbi:hypothetical protein [Janthinobacterium sp.]|uniref:hypothetical protein n=1 Tax=Janthinobacterium sp. TaxID=1871054 RepID=UPI0025830748|nr:hypothetical protein [Janthinobacterium sp.]MCX7293597.1 hypothetical protein [Janthinobacterium sp.]